MCEPHLLLRRIYYALHRTIEEPCYIFAVELQLSKSNVASGVIVTSRPKLDVLWLPVIAEADFGGFVEAADNVVQVFDKVGFRKVIYTGLREERGLGQ
jgi:NADPH:quinone reductase-like Zn-dependent oxidoreductase